MCNMSIVMAPKVNIISSRHSNKRYFSGALRERTLHQLLTKPFHLDSYIYDNLRHCPPFTLNQVRRPTIGRPGAPEDPVLRSRLRSLGRWTGAPAESADEPIGGRRSPLGMSWPRPLSWLIGQPGGQLGLRGWVSELVNPDHGEEKDRGG